jgi:copper transport protein
VDPLGHGGLAVELITVRRGFVVVLLAGLWLLASGPAAGAHALLRASDPADGASVDQPPRQVTLTFTERPEPRLSVVHVLDVAGQQVEAGGAAPVDGNPLQLRVPLGELPDGTYTVSWRTVSRDDGHVTAGAFAFGVGVVAPAAGMAGASPQAATTPPPSPLAVAGRWLLYLGLALLLGAAATGQAIYGGRLPAGARPLLLAGAGLGVVGLAARVVAGWSAVGASVGALLASDTGRHLVWLAAGVLASATAAGLLAARLAAAGRPDQPAEPTGSQQAGRQRPAGEIGRGWLGVVGVAAAATMLLEVLAGHAAAPSSLRALNLAAQWLHLVAVGAWAGGLVWLLAGLLGRDHPSQKAGAGHRAAPVDRVQAAAGFSRLALPVVGVIAVTGLVRAVDLAGGWRGLLDTSFGRVLDVKVLVFAAVLVLAARNRYRLLPALADPAGPLGALRRSVAGEVGLVACVLLAAAVLTQLPPGKFAVATPAARPAPPPSVQVQGSDVTTSVRLALTVTPGTPGPNTFTTKVTDYDSGQPVPARRVTLRFTLPDRPEVGGATLELARGGDGLWQAGGSQLSIDGRWAITALVEAPGMAVTVPLELHIHAAEPRVTVSRAPGQPDLYTITVSTGGGLQAYVDPGRPGANTVHFTFFTAAGGEQPVDEAHARMTTPLGQTQTIDLQVLSAGHFAANASLQPGRTTFKIDATPSKGPPITASFSQQIK